MFRFIFKFAAGLSFLIWLAPNADAETSPRILIIGDSMLAAHKSSGNAVGDHLARNLKAHVTDKSVLGARMIYKLPLTGAMGMSIPMQFRKGNWDWIIVNGGGNDLWFGCGCGQCNRKMNKLIAEDSRSGEIPRLALKARQTGAKVVFVGYLRSPGMGSPIESCKDEGDELERRIAKMSTLDKGITFVSIADLVPYGDRSYFGLDMIHPSLKGSRAIAARLVNAISN